MFSVFSVACVWLCCAGEHVQGEHKYSALARSHDSSDSDSMSSGGADLMLDLEYTPQADSCLPDTATPCRFNPFDAHVGRGEGFIPLSPFQLPARRVWCGL